MVVLVVPLVIRTMAFISSAHFSFTRIIIEGPSEYHTIVVQDALSTSSSNIENCFELEKRATFVSDSENRPSRRKTPRNGSKSGCRGWSFEATAYTSINQEISRGASGNPAERSLRRPQKLQHMHGAIHPRFRRRKAGFTTLRAHLRILLYQSLGLFLAGEPAHMPHVPRNSDSVF